MLRGVNLSGLEFSSGFQSPMPSAISYYKGKGMQAYRIPILRENLQPGGWNSPAFDPAYLQKIKDTLTLIGSGAYTILDIHNYGRFGAAGGQTGGNRIGESGLNITNRNYGYFMQAVADAFKGLVSAYGMMNEPTDNDLNVVVGWLSAGIWGIRTRDWDADVIVQFPSYGNRWTYRNSSAPIYTAWSQVIDFAGKKVLDYHCYLDTYSAGNSASIDSGWAATVDTFLSWAKNNSIPFIVGELATGPDSASLAALSALMTKLKAAPTCKAALWWGAGGYTGDGAWNNLDPFGTPWEPATWVNPTDKPQMSTFLS